MDGKGPALGGERGHRGREGSGATARAPNEHFTTRGGKPHTARRVSRAGVRGATCNVTHESSKDSQPPALTYTAVNTKRHVGLFKKLQTQKDSLQHSHTLCELAEGICTVPVARWRWVPLRGAPSGTYQNLSLMPPNGVEIPTPSLPTEPPNPATDAPTPVGPTSKPRFSAAAFSACPRNAQGVCRRLGLAIGSRTRSRPGQGR